MDNTVITQEPKRSFIKSRLFKILLGVVIFVIAIAIILFVSVTLATAKPKKVSNEFLNSCLNGDTTHAYNMTEYDFKRVTGFEEFSDYCKKTNAVLAGKPSVNGKEIEGGTTTTTSRIYYKANRKNGGNYYIKITLQKDNGNWYVLSMDGSRNAYSQDL